MGNSKLKSPFVLAMRVQQSDSTEYNSCLLPETKDETFRGGMRQPYGRALVSPASDAAKLRNFVINENFLVGKIDIYFSCFFLSKISTQAIQLSQHRDTLPSSRFDQSPLQSSLNEPVPHIVCPLTKQ